MSDSPPPARWHTREDSGIRLDRDLVWWHDGERFEHPKVIEVFNSSLVPTEDGRFQVRIGKDWCFVDVEDAAYQVTAIDHDADAIYLRLSDRQGERLEPSTLVLEGDVLVCRVKGGRAKARFSRPAQFALGQLCEEGQGGWTLSVGNRRVPLPFSPA